MEVSITTGLLAVQPITGNLVTNLGSIQSGANYIGQVGITGNLTSTPGLTLSGANYIGQVGVTGSVAQAGTWTSTIGAGSIGVTGGPITAQESGRWIVDISNPIAATQSGVWTTTIGAGLVGITGTLTSTPGITPSGGNYIGQVGVTGNVAQAGTWTSTIGAGLVGVTGGPVLSQEYGRWLVDISNPITANQGGTWTTTLGAGLVGVTGGPVNSQEFGRWIVDVSNPVTANQGGTWTITIGNPVATQTFLNASSAGQTTIVPAQGAGIKIMVVGAQVMSWGAPVVEFRSGTSPISAGWPVATNGGFVLAQNDLGWFKTAANATLNLNLSAGVTTVCQIVWQQTTI